MSCCGRTRRHPQTPFGECPGSESTSGGMCSDGDRQGFSESHQRCSRVGTCRSHRGVTKKRPAWHGTRAASNPQSQEMCQKCQVHPSTKVHHVLQLHCIPAGRRKVGLTWHMYVYIYIIYIHTIINTNILQSGWKSFNETWHLLHWLHWNLFLPS